MEEKNKRNREDKYEAGSVSNSRGRSSFKHSEEGLDTKKFVVNRKRNG